VLSAPIAILIAVAGARIWALRSRVIKGTAMAFFTCLSFMVVRVAFANHQTYVSGRDFLPALTTWLSDHPKARLWTRASIQNEMDLRFGYRFSDPVHQHLGSPGYGSVIDASFWELHREGDFVLVQPDWLQFSALYPAVDRRKLKLATLLHGPYSTATIYEVKPLPRSHGSHFLSDDDPVRITQPLGALQWDQSFDGSTMLLNGVPYDKGIGTHSGSEIVFAIDGHYKVFSADVGLDDTADRTPGSVVFAVYADGKLMGQSPVMRWDSPTVSLQIDVTGVSELKLVVEDAGDGNVWDHADWANATISDGSTEPLHSE
jgi:hypothetical protein